jgi:hypothetical protein
MIQMPISCMTESTEDSSAVPQLLPLLDYVEMDGSLLFAEDCAAGVTINSSRAQFPNETGCGVNLI